MPGLSEELDPLQVADLDVFFKVEELPGSLGEGSWGGGQLSDVGLQGTCKWALNVITCHREHP